jgi:hypothetical protein
MAREDVVKAKYATNGLMNLTLGVTTLALGSRLRQGLARVRAKKEVQESHLMFLGVYNSP